MALVMNASNKVQRVKVFGNWFTFQPDQIKVMNDNIAHFIAIERRDYGLISIPEKFSDLEYQNSDEGKEELAKYKEEGVKARINYLDTLIYNEKVSLQRDLDIKGIKSSAEAFYSDALVDWLEEKADYAFTQDDKQKERLERIKKLEEKLEKLGG